MIVAVFLSKVDSFNMDICLLSKFFPDVVLIWFLDFQFLRIVVSAINSAVLGILLKGLFSVIWDKSPIKQCEENSGMQQYKRRDRLRLSRIFFKKVCSPAWHAS